MLYFYGFFFRGPRLKQFFQQFNTELVFSTTTNFAAKFSFIFATPRINRRRGDDGESEEDSRPVIELVAMERLPSSSSDDSGSE